jgi:hypothetical protein
VGRRVRVDKVQIPVWSTKALAWGYDPRTDEHIGFAVSPERGRALRVDIEGEGEAFVEIADVEVLFVRRAGDAPGTVAGALFRA